MGVLWLSCLGHCYSFLFTVYGWHGMGICWTCWLGEFNQKYHRTICVPLRRMAKESMKTSIVFIASGRNVKLWSVRTDYSLSFIPLEALSTCIVHWGNKWSHARFQWLLYYFLWRAYQYRTLLYFLKWRNFQHWSSLKFQNSLWLPLQFPINGHFSLVFRQSQARPFRKYFLCILFDPACSVSSISQIQALESFGTFDVKPFSKSKET